MQRSRGRARIATALAVGATALGIAEPGWAATGSRICRSAIGKGVSTAITTGFKGNDTCHKVADKALQDSTDCNDPTSLAFDPGGKYAKSKAKSDLLIGKGCAPADPVLNNYDGDSVSGAVYPDVDSTIAGNSLLVVGGKNLSTNPTNPQPTKDEIKARSKCVETIGKSRTGIAKEVILGSIKCQKGKDATASSFGALDATCLNPGTKSSAKAVTLINKFCSSFTDPATALGTCAPLPDCAVSSAVLASQHLAKVIYQEKTPASACGNGTLDPGEQCDDGANNGTPGDLCNTKCESLANTCGPGTVAGGSIIGHRITTVNLNVPGGKQLAGVQVGFDYPQLESSIPGTGNSSVVRNAIQIFPVGGLSVVNDDDTFFTLSLANASEFISSGPLFQAALNQCVPLSSNVCNRNQNVTGCCPGANLDACNRDFLTGDNVHYYDDCKCGAPFRGVQLSDCTTNYKLKDTLGPCNVGACASPPSSIKCTNECTAGGFSKVNTPHACTAATVNTDCASTPTCDDPGTMTCTDGDPAKIGAACTATTAAADCGPIPTPTCSGGKFCTAGDATQIGHTCSINNDCGTPLTVATCQACPQLGDRNNGTFGCLDVFNGPICTPGHFPVAATGGCDGTASGPIGGCPLGNTCERQDEITTNSCSVSNPVDHLGQPVDNVTCSITVIEAP